MNYWKSIRKSIDKQIGEETIKKLLKSGKERLDNLGEKLWTVTIIQGQEQIAEINKLTKQAMTKKSSVPIIKRLGKTKDFDIFYGAPTIIMISVKDRSKALSKICGDSVHRIINNAKNMGIQARWNSFIRYNFFDKSKLDIPEGYTPYYAIAVGCNK